MWNDKKIEKLIEIYHNTSNVIISEILCIDKRHIVPKANKIGLKKDKEFITNIRKINNPGTFYSDSDILFIKENYVSMSNLEIAIKLNKTKKSISRKLKSLNLFRCKTEKDYITAKKSKENGRDLNFDFVMDIAKKYNCRYEFGLKDSSAYSAAIKHGWIDDICSHMVVKNFSLPQLILKDILEFIFKEKCSYNNRKIIKPLEIDCYFDKWNLGFEYDGRYFHNEEKDIAKKNKCLNEGITLINISEKTSDFKNYEKNIKRQIIENIQVLRAITNIDICEDSINNYSPKIIFPNILTIHEKTLIKSKKMSEIKLIDFELYKIIKRYKLYNKPELLIENDLKSNNKFNSISEYKNYLILKKYSSFNEMCKYEHPYRLVKMFNTDIKEIKELYEK